MRSQKILNLLGRIVLVVYFMIIDKLEMANHMYLHIAWKKEGNKLQYLIYKNNMRLFD